MSAEFVRVKDKATGHEYSARRPDLSKVDVIDKPATDRFGRALAAKPNISGAKRASASKKSDLVASPTDTQPQEGSAS